MKFSNLFEGALNAPQTLYHITPSTNANQILEQGLRIGSARSTCGKETQKKIYLTESLTDMDNPFPHHENWMLKDMTVFEVSSGKLSLKKDPEYPDGKFWMSSDDVPSSSLKTLGRHVFKEFSNKFNGYKYSGV